jgi:hypothetical protein
MDERLVADPLIHETDYERSAYSESSVFGSTLAATDGLPDVAAHSIDFNPE